MYASERRPRRGSARGRGSRQNRGLGDLDNPVDESEDYEYVLDSDGGFGGMPGTAVKVKSPKIPAGQAVPLAKLRKDVRQVAVTPAEEQAEYEYSIGDVPYAGEQEELEYANVGGGGLGNFFTDLLNIGPKIYVPGVTGAPAPTHYNVWRAAAIARGHTIVRMPSGAQAGAWAEMTVDASGQKLYGLAPQSVQDEDAQITAFAQSASNIANIPEAAVAKVASVAGAVGAGARSAVASTLGIPSWAMPVLLLGGAALVARSFLPARR